MGQLNSAVNSPFDGSRLTYAIAGIWALILAVNAPGHLSFDSVVQLYEGRSNLSNGMHPPIMSALLGVLDGVIPGTAVYLALVSGLLIASVLIMLRQSARPGFGLLVFLIIAVSPVILIYQGIIWKDVLFANSAVLAFSLLTSEARTADLYRRKVPHVGASLFIAVAVLTRQNGFIITPFFFAAIYFAYLSYSKSVAVKHVIVSAGSFLFFLVVFSQIAGVMIVKRADSEFSQGLRVLIQYDIAAIIARVPAARDAIPNLPEAEAPEFITDLQTYYTPERMDYLADSILYKNYYPSIDTAELFRIWRELVFANNKAYFNHRTEVLRWTIFPPDPKKCLPIHVGISGNEELVEAMGLSSSSRPSDVRLYEYSSLFFDTPLFIGGAYCLVAAAIIVFLARGNSEEGRIVAFMLGSGIAFALSYSAIGIACDFRYTYFTALATLLATVFCVAGRTRASC